MIITKFGGTSVADAPAIRRLVRIVEARKAATPLVVVSALAGVSDALDAAWLAGTGDPERRQRTLDEVAARHTAIVGELGIEGCSDQLERQVLAMRSSAGGTPGIDGRADWLAGGELLSSTLVAAALESCGLPALWFDARRVLRTVGENPVEDRPDEAAIARLAAEHLTDSIAGRIVVTQGFIGADATGRTTLLGRGGSDYTAALLGAALAASRIEIWTDVDGVLTGPPKIVPGARRLKRLSFAEAAELAYFGAKVLHPATMRPARVAGIPVLVANSRREPADATIGTTIVDEFATDLDERSVVRSVAAKKNVTVVTVHSGRMLLAHGFLERIFAVFARHSTPVDLVSTSEVSVSMTVDDARSIAAIVCDLDKLGRVEIAPEMAIVCVVGAGMREALGIPARIFRAVGNAQVRMISQGASEINVSLVVGAADADGVVRRLHEEFFHGNLPRSVFGESLADLDQADSARTGVSVLPPHPLAAVAARLAERHGTPFYAYDLTRIESQIAQLRRSTPDRRFRLLYACKANGHPAILRLMAANDIGIDAVSPMEVGRAIDCGIEPGSILFTATNVAPEAMLAVLDRGVRVNLGSLSDLRRLTAMRRGVDLFLRVNPGIGDGHHEHVVTGGADSKFGMSVDDVGEAQAILAASGNRAVGLHGHIGSGIVDAEQILESTRRLAELATSLPDVRVINAGGGFGVPYRPGDPELDLDALGRGLEQIVSGLEQRLGRPFELWLEPGRYLVAQCGTLVVRVTCKKRVGDHMFVGVDSGFNHLLRPALYGAYHQIRNLSGTAETVEFVDVVGNLCESADVFAWDRPLRQVLEGDLLAIEDAGAYGFVMASHYNLWPLPHEIVLRGDREIADA